MAAMTGTREALRLLLILSILIFAIEVAIMAVLNLVTITNPTLEALLDASALTLLLFPVLYVLSFRELVAKNRALSAAESSLRGAQANLEHRIEEQTQDLRAANASQADSLSELEERRREIEILSNMVKMFQACRDLEETYTVAQSELCRLFPGRAGALYVMKSSRNLMDRVLSWGEGADFSESFAPEQCWALRFGKPHHAGPNGSAISCAHANLKDAEDNLCVPISAYGEVLGAFCLRRSFDSVESGRWAGAPTPEQLKFYATVAENLALAVANLRLRETLRHQALRDSLTGLFNRRYLIDSLEHELERAESRGEPLSVAMFDIYSFKRFNDEFGHDAGDVVLSALGSFLQKQLLPTDLVARYGGDEFVIVMTDTEIDTAKQRTTVLREQVAALPVKHNDQLLHGVSISIGIASFPRHGENAKDLFQAADAAMYEAKKTGKNGVSVADLRAHSNRGAGRETGIETAA